MGEHQRMSGSLVVITGASGVGKTSIALATEKAKPEISVFRFDSIGVPNPEIMMSYGTGYQPGGAWQRSMTLQWFDQIAPLLELGRSVLFEGQMRIAFIHEALALHEISWARIILVECNDEIRNSRLINERQQPELADENMSGWGRFLHQEAIESGARFLIPVLSRLPIALVESLPTCMSN